MGKNPNPPLRAFALVQLVLCVTIRETCAQERPSLFASQNDTGVSFRQNVCARHKSFDRGEFDLRNALRGVELRPGFGDWGGEFFHLDPKTGGIDENDVAVQLVDKLAQRAGFSWRNSYGVYGAPMEGTSWTDLAVWTAETFDFSVDFWLYSTERLNQGLIYLPGWYDGSYIMVGEETLDSSTNLFSWLAPFDYKVWIMIVVTVVLSGVIYWAMDRLNSPSVRSRIQEQKKGWRSNGFSDPTKGARTFHNPTDNFYMTALAVTGHFEFHPDTIAAMLFTFSLAFWSLLLVAAYTANLASFFVVENTPTLGVKTIDDAVIRQLPICIWKDTSMDTYLTKRFPAYQSFLRYEDEKEYLLATTGPSRKCQVAVTTISSWDVYEKRRGVNPDCKLSWIGRVVKFVPASFVTKADSGTLCSSLIRDVLSLHLEEMKEAGEVDAIWDEHIRKTADQECAAVSVSSTSTYNGINQLSLEGMGGAFVIHYILATVAVLVAVFTNLRRRKINGRHRSNEDDKSETSVPPMEPARAPIESTASNEIRSGNGQLFVSKLGKELAKEDRRAAEVVENGEEKKDSWQDSWQDDS